jgi:3-isopropylmalate/(R)-2-methylmalate dehydratase large subunit
MRLLGENMRQTIVEKILSERSGKRVKSGEVVIAGVDFCFAQDGTSALVIDSFKGLGVEEIVDKNKFCMVMDHAAPSPSIDVAGVHDKMRSFAKAYGVQLFDAGAGVCHQVFSETGFITCGDLVAGADSHTCTYGALNAMAVGVSSTDLAIILASGKNWFKVPETIKIEVDGDLPKGVYSKDITLMLVKDIGASGASYRSIEFCGETIDSMSMDARFTVANMAVEMGAKCGIMKADKKALDWAKKHCVREPKPVEADPDARYAEIRKYDISDFSPQVARPHAVDNVCSVEEAAGIRVDVVSIGTCANGRMEDMEIAARVIKGKKVAHGIKLIVTPSSKKVYLDMLKKGLVEVFIDAGAIVNNPGCGPCSGTHQGVLADGEVAFSTANRNFKGRMGNLNSEIYLGSPATAAATAIAGKIADPREYKRKL